MDITYILVVIVFAMFVRVGIADLTKAAVLCGTDLNLFLLLYVYTTSILGLLAVDKTFHVQLTF
jgi:hypothetical protein